MKIPKLFKKAAAFDRSFGASEQAQRYAAGSNLFQRVL